MTPSFEVHAPRFSVQRYIASSANSASAAKYSISGHRYDPAMANSIRHYRKLRNMTQQQTADALGIHLTNYNKLERGRSAPDMSRFEKLAEIFEVSVSELLAERSNDSPSGDSDGNSLREAESMFTRLSPDSQDAVLAMMKALLSRDAKPE